MGASEGRLETQGQEFELPSLLAAAYELKTPLVLLRQLSLQLNETPETATPELKRRMLLTAERTLRLIDGVTRAARLEDSLFDTESLELGAVCQLVSRELQPLARELGQNLEVALPRRSLLAVGQYDMLTALLTGLCDNALSYNAKGSSVIISGRERSGRVELSVRDHGPVLTREQFRELTHRSGEPQLRGGRPRNSGLGLWVAANFARCMSATLHAHRHRSGGMTFTVSLPQSSQMSLL